MSFGLPSCFSVCEVENATLTLCCEARGLATDFEEFGAANSQKVAAPVTSATGSPKIITNAEITTSFFIVCEKPDRVIFINELHIFMGLTFYPETSHNCCINAQET